MPIRRTPVSRSVPCAIALCALLGPLASSAHADDRETGAEPRARLGVGLGGSWLPVSGGTSTLVARVSAGFDVGRYSLRALPTFHYATAAAYPTSTMSAGYLAIEGAFRITPRYAVSVAPLVGYTHAPDPDPHCYDVCYDSQFGDGLTLGVDVSPASLVFGDGSFEVGVHGVGFEYPASGQVSVSAFVELRWLFAQASDQRPPTVTGAL